MKKNRHLTILLIILFGFNTLFFGEEFYNQSKKKDDKNQDSVQKKDKSAFKMFLEDEKELL